MKALCGWIASAVVVLALIVGLVAFGGWVDTGPFGFDGNVAEPGCDWGNPNCEADDYRHMCASFDGSVRDARFVQWCEGVRHGG